MGDLSNEPSMEEILSSIKRIIAEEGDTAPRVRRGGRPAPVPEAEPEAGPDADRAEVLELSDPIPADRPAAERRSQERPLPERVEKPRAERVAAADRTHPTAAERAEPAAAAPYPDESRASAPRPAPVRAAEAVSPGTVEATRGALDHLSRMLVRPEPGSDGTLEGMVREMIRPMLRDWLDAHLPTLVQDMVAREIGRITGSQR